MNFGDLLLPSLKSRFPGLSPAEISGISKFANLLYAENQVQNLTRIEGVDDFIDGHLVDVVELLKSGWLGSKVADIGSGSGVPGLLAASMDPNGSREWVLIESELHKANYLAASADKLGLNRVQVIADRAENHARDAQVDTYIARAVGPVDKIAAWIWNCSTWNNLVLFKSKGWAAEWERAKTTKFGRKLTVTHTHEYSSADKYRVLVNLTRT